MPSGRGRGRERTAGSCPHVVHLFETFDLGEAQLRTVRLISALGERYRHTIIAMDRRAEARGLIPGELDVGVIGPPEGRWIGLGRLLRLLDPDLILLSAGERVTAFLAAARLDVPLLLQIDGASAAERIGRPPGRRLLRRIRTAVTSSEQSLAKIQAMFAPLRVPVALVPVGVVVGRAAPTVAIGGLERRPGEVVLGMLLPPRPVPGLLTILHAFHDAPHHRVAHLILFGNGPDRPALAQEADRLDIRGRVVFVDEAVDPAALARECDLFALAESGGIGRHLALEAMAAGLPLIGIAGPELQALISPGNREFLLAPDRRPSLAAKMDALLRSSQLRRRLGRGNLDRARELPLAAMAEGYDELFGRVLDGRSPAGERPRPA